MELEDRTLTPAAQKACHEVGESLYAVHKATTTTPDWSRCISQWQAFCFNAFESCFHGV